MPEPKSSRLPGFYKLDLGQRLQMLAQTTDLDSHHLADLAGQDALTPEAADHMIENVIGVFGLPLGIATNFIVNGREVLVPMAVEEPSIVAGASNMARLARDGDGFQAETTEPEMIGQMQILDLEDLKSAESALNQRKEDLLAVANEIDPVIKKLGGGARDLILRKLPETPAGPMLIAHLIYDTRDAMGANAVNTAVEKLAPLVEAITGGRVHLRILSNLADRRLAQATCRIPVESLAFADFSGQEVRDGVIEAWAFAQADPYRAATHNKGIMNGIDAVVLATGNDWRAVEAGAHAYAAREGQYTSLSRWSVSEDGSLEGWLELPLALGSVGGATRVHPAAQACLALMGVENARQLAEITVSVGLAQNLAALRALSTEGIQRGHMALHARQVATSAGAVGAMVDKLAARMVQEGVIRLDRAQELLQELSN
jgi:hydroxymethylglutaryl-CoA reductase